MRGDVMLLAEGDRVPADAVLVDCRNFSVDESALTGESVSVRKVAVESDEVSAPMGRPGGDATPWMFSGMLVVKGHGIAVAKETGAATELGKDRHGAADDRTGAHTPAARDRPAGKGSRGRRSDGRRNRRGGVRADARQLAQRVRAGIATAMALLPEEFPAYLLSSERPSVPGVNA